MNAQELLRSRLIGTLFVERGLVSESQIRLALEIQQETDQQLGEILVERFGLSRAELAQVVAEQWQDAGRAAGPGLEGSLSENWRRIGEIFVTRGFVTEEELEQALTRQRQTGERLGEALVGLGVISKFELAGALGEQMSTVDEPAGGEARQAEVVQLHAVSAPEDEAVDVVDEAAEAVEEPAPPDDPVLELVAEAEEQPLALVDAESPEAADLEPVEQPVEADEPVPVLAGVAPEPTWPEGEYVPPARPSPTLGAVNGSAEPVPAPDLLTAPCVAFVSTPAGYRVVPVGHEAPDVGAVLEVEGHGELLVVRHVRSPLPHDDRICLVVEPTAQPLVYSFA
jgi:hypothetical protein